MLSHKRLSDVWEHGFTIIPNFLPRDVVNSAREAAWNEHPHPLRYFSQPGKFRELRESQWAGTKYMPFGANELNLLPVRQEYIELATSLLGVDDFEIHRVDLWAKYAGAVDYETRLHRDYRIHTQLVPSTERSEQQITTILWLTDVDEADGPTRLVPLRYTRHIPMWEWELPVGYLTDVEVSAAGPAGTLIAYRTDVFHRATNLSGHDRFRLALFVDFQRVGSPWRGHIAWSQRALRAGWTDAIVSMTPRQRTYFGWPYPGEKYWTCDTINAVGRRYPGADMSPYLAALHKDAYGQTQSG